MITRWDGEDGIAVCTGGWGAAGARTGEVPGKASKAALEDGVHWMVMDAGWMAEHVCPEGVTCVRQLFVLVIN